ncbi:MAG TPA: hypothetical protein VF444_06140 [Pseudonocardiaceae bacterium]
MFDRLFGDLPGEPLPLASYRADFAARFDVSDGHDSWKLERLQHFKEPGDLSWTAFHRGDWNESLRLLDSDRTSLEELNQDSARRGINLYRVRVVEKPLTPYLHWELYGLRIAAEYGEKIRVVGPETVRQFERGGVLPELVTLGADTVYQVQYDTSGLLDGAVRFIDPDVTARTVKFIESLYDLGEDLASYFNREVAPLPPPTVS